MSSSVHCTFLYQTRTILQHQVRSQRAWRRSMASSSEPNSRIQKSNSSSIEGNDSAPSFLQQKAKDVLARQAQSKTPSTIPQYGQPSFDNIWKHFESSTILPPSPSTTPKHPITSTAQDHTSTDPFAILELFSSISKPDPQHEQESDDAHRDDLEDKDTISFAPFSRPSSFQTQTATKTAAVAEIADYLFQDDQSQPPSSATIATPQDDLLNQTARSMMYDISASFDTAIASSSTLRLDHAVWRICEEKIFPLVQLLTPPRPSLSHQIPSTPSSPHLPHQAQPHPLIPSSVPLLPLLSLLYPSTLLLTLRLLTTLAPASPYISSLLPRIKSLGPTSYVLGVNTYFYNCLLSVRWNVYSDVRGIDNLLGEMERNGLEFDGGTLGVLRRIAEEREIARGVESEDGKVMGRKGKGRMHEEGKLEYGDRSRQWWTMREVNKGLDRLDEWKVVVARRLDEKGLGEVMREGEEDMIAARTTRVSSSTVGNNVVNEAEYVVTL